jgi:cysteinyl-tRNA synthetase
MVLFICIDCGPTVYWNPHIGNHRAFITWDVLARALRYSGYSLKRVMNITDVGHMTEDEDFGVDKMEVGAKKEGITPIEIANKYIKAFLSDLELLNVQFPDGSEVVKDFDVSKLSSVNMTRATDFIAEMIELIKKMEQDGFTYETDQAVYFDISKYPEYTKLSGQVLEENVIGARDEVKVDSQKKHPADFVLWMKAVGQYENHVMKWPSPWGVGFPGWHIECSAMGTAVLGYEIDIHTGGIEHIGVHHPNERAQNYGVSHKEIVKMWVHNEHLQSISGDKLAKSKGNAFTLEELIEKGFDPMDLRMLIAINNYRVPLRFSLEVLENTKQTRLSLINKLRHLKSLSVNEKGVVIEEFKRKFIDALENDLNVSVAYSVLNEVLKSDNSAEDKLATIYDFDNVFALGLKTSVEGLVIPEVISKLAAERQEAKASGNYSKADTIRDEIYSQGYTIKDLGNGKFEILKN